MDWIDVARGRDRRRAVASAVLNLRVGSIKWGEFD